MSAWTGDVTRPRAKVTIVHKIVLIILIWFAIHILAKSVSEEPEPTGSRVEVKK